LNATRRLFAVLAVCALAATPALAVIVKAPSALDALSRTDPSLVQGRQVAPLAEVASALPNRAGWETLRGALGPHSEIYFDLATGEPAMVKGAPEPFIPGAGNGLTLGDVGRVLGRQVDGVDEAVMTDLGGRFLDRNAALFRVPRAEIVDRSAVLVNDNLWVVTFLHAPGGIPVAGLSLDELAPAAGHAAQPVAGAHEVEDDRHVPLAPVGLVADRADQAAVVVVGAVGEVEAHHVEAGVDHPADHLAG
jgi:hypothetical protein